MLHTRAVPVDTRSTPSCADGCERKRESL